MAEATYETALADITRHLRELGRRFALVGGVAVSLRAEARFTRDVDLAVDAADDADMERLVYDLQTAGYTPVAVVEHRPARRLSTVRLASPSGVVVDLLAASSGIEAETVARATPVAFGDLGDLPVARAEELLAMKVLSMSDRRPQDRIDATSLLLVNDALDLDAVRANLDAITARGFHRDQDLRVKLSALLTSLTSD